MKEVVLIMGSLFCNKETYAKILSQKKNYKFLNMEELVKEEILSNTKIGSAIKKHNEANIIVPDEYYIMLVKNSIINLKENGIVICGFPSSVFQAKMIDSFLFSRKNNQAITVALEVDPFKIVPKLNEVDDKILYDIKINNFNNIIKPIFDYYSDRIKKINISDDNFENVVNKIIELLK